MELELISKRLLLRPLTESDVDWYSKMLTDSDVVRYIFPTTPLEIDVINKMPHFLKRGDGGRIGIWVIADRHSNSCLGSIFLLPLPIEDKTNWNQAADRISPDCEIELGYTLTQASWGKGIATEAANRLLKFVFEETSLTEVVAVIDPNNHASRKVLIKAGFSEEGLRRAYGEELPAFRINRDALRLINT